MVRLTAVMVEGAAQRTNPAKERELDLRGYRISVIESLGATRDQFDTFDLSDNEIRRLDGFPHLPRIKTLLVNNNRLSKLGDSLATNLPNLQRLVLTNNMVAVLSDVVEPLRGCTKLTHLCLLRNPVANVKQYRLLIIHSLPQIRVLDFSKVKASERDEARKLFAGTQGSNLLAQASSHAADTPKEAEVRETRVIRQPDAENEPPKKQVKTAAPSSVALSSVQTAALRAAIVRASSLEQVERLQHALRTGLIPPELALELGLVAPLAVEPPASLAAEQAGQPDAGQIGSLGMPREDEVQLVENPDADEE